MGLRAGGRGARGGIGAESFAGGGGGAVEVGAIGSISISGEVLARGGDGLGDGSGGGGGEIYLHAPVVSLSGDLDASGGFGQFGSPFAGYGHVAGGGGGGGGEILVEAGRFDDRGGIMFVGGGVGGLGFPDGTGGGDGTAGADGLVTVVVAVPEPSSLILLASGMTVGMVGWRRRFFSVTCWPDTGSRCSG